ncbi:hypothetical protein Plec18167_000441 [Paecilomyces lecythidis]|uniref:Transaldolase n=1 Tax=Paecilomyces lecythidis TaxID=3004212 RepID=A0ABR3YDX3_9EURO
MGVDTRRPMLPAPTESITGGSATGTDLATDVSRRTDKTSYSIPDDGSPITISTRRKSHNRDKDESNKLTRSSHQSQTSLLIEYFEGGKGTGNLHSRPSVRVRVTPSAARKLRDQTDHIQITESGGSRKPVYTRRISLGNPSKQKQLPEASIDDQSISSYNSAADEGHTAPRRSPLEIEFVDRDQTSEASNVSRDARYMQPTSDISSMPPDSLLDGPSAQTPRRKRSQSLNREGAREPDELLKAPSRRRSRSLSRERIAHKVAEKLNNQPRDVSSGHSRRSQKSMSRADSKEFLETDSKSPRRKLQKSREDDILGSPESSLLSASAVSSRRKSGDQYSFRSGTSRSSINNPKLLETVEDAIRRLILPELKELKKDQKVTSNTSKFEREMGASRGSGSSASRDELGRRLSKHASAPDVKNPTVILHKDSKDEGIILSDDRSTEHKEQEKEYEETSPSDKTYIKGARPDLTEEEKLRRQRSKGLRDAEAAGIVGTALTTAALKHHDSQSSMDKRERRKRRSRGHSREPSFNETELVFQKHNVAPMPMRSEIDSELTRESILSQRTEGTTTPRQGVEVRNVSHGSPRGSAGSSTPTRRTPRGGRKLGTYHSNMSNGDLSIHSASERDLHKTSHSSLADSDSGTAGAIAAAAAANLLGDHQPHETEPDYSDQRALSPIQSVASDNGDTERGGEWNFETAEHGEPRLSIDSLSSAPSTSLARSKRLAEANFEKEDEIQDRYDEAGVELGYEEESPREPKEGHWEESSETDDDDGYQRSTARPSADDIRIDEKRMTNYTDDSLDASYVDKATEGRQVSDGVASKPEYVHPPVAVESAVASLLDPSVLSGTRSGVESPNRRWAESPKVAGDASRDLYGSDRGSPLKQRQDAATPDETSFPKRMGVTSPPQSVAQSFEDEDEIEQPRGDTTGPTDAESPTHEAEYITDSESEINTNPSIIQGPIAGVPHDNRDHWPYNPTPPKSQGDHYSADRDFDNNMADGGMGFTDQTGYDTYYQSPYGNSYGQDYMAGNMYSTPPGAKDEGYISAANPRSPSIATPEQKDKEYASLFDNSPNDMFTPGHQRQISGYSHGIPSPLYDSATGRGIEAIQSKDIVALMDHLTVRDAQRNARDTEILVTLVRSAAEMRTSFEEMKRFIAAQDGIIMESNEKQHERTHRIIGGPRPLPPSGSRSRQLAVEDGEDLRSKRRNVFKRALKGLSLKSSNDLTKIEDMLMQLLDEVEALRAAQEGRTSGAGPQPASVGSTEHGPSSYQDGYEPEGQAGTSSTGDQSGYLSNSSRPIPESHGVSGRRGSENRVSTVPEADEEFDVGNNNVREFPGRRFSSDDRYSVREERGTSAPLSSPPQMPVASGALSNETSPKANEKSKKHKSSSSSFFPKISRWSKTTASSMGDNIRNTIQPGRKERPFSDASRSGSDLVHGPYNTADYYDPNGDDRIRSTYTLDEGRRQENRPPSPLIPSQVSENPKYQAHRGSLDLQHPQPRQGPTGRFQSQLESEAQNFTPISPNSEAWGSNPSLLHPGQTQNRFSYGSRLSPISDAGYSEQASLSEKQNAPPRPPKIKDDGPLVPQRTPKVKEDEQQPSYADRVVSRQGSSMRSTPPQRKPTGPRPITGSGQYSPGNARRHRYRGSPDQVDDDY